MGRRFRGNGLAAEMATGGHRARAAIAATLVVAATLIFELTPAQAGVGLSATPTFPTNVMVGQSGVAASLTITNLSTGTEATGNVTLTNITLVPSCGQTVPAAPDCDPAQLDPGVFQLSTSGIGAAGTACAGTNFAINVIDAAQGKVQFVPAVPVVLVNANSSCQINFTFTVLKVPTKDASAPTPGLQTGQLGFAAASHTNGTVGGGTGTSIVTVAPQAQPTITTQATSNAAIGQPISDTATLAGGVTPTGSITFRAFGPADATCAAAPAFTSAAIPVNGNGAYASGNFTPTSAGTYRWTATYTGDASNLGVASPCNDANETSIVAAATPAITTQATPASATNGPISDTATLAGGVNPTGTITFRAFGPADPTCAAAPAFTSAGVVVNGNGNYNSGNFIATAAGTYLWRATYSGDANNAAVATPCNAANEASQVTAPNPAITTQASPAVVVGGTVTDTATLTGGVNPTGNIVFTLFGPDNATCAGAPAFTSTVPVNGNGNYTSGGFVVPSPGTYRWIANYTGGGGNPAVTTACNAANESVQVAKKVPTLVTQASADVTIGGAISDTATLADGVNPTGSIAFNVFGPNDATCTGTPAFSVVKTVAGNGAYPSGPFTPTRAGAYRWVATYGGDANNAAVGPTACAEPAERVRVNRFQPVITTQSSGPVPLGGSITDTATLSGGLNPTGTLIFNAYGPEKPTCAGVPPFSSRVSVNGNGTYSSGPFTPTVNGVYRWVVVYTGDDNNSFAVSGCDEPSETVLVGTANPSTTTTLPGPTATTAATTTTTRPPVTTPTTAPPTATVTTTAQNPAVRGLVVTGAYAARLVRFALILMVVGTFALAVIRRPKKRTAGRS